MVDRETTDREERLARLTPEQRKLLERTLAKKKAARPKERSAPARRRSTGERPVDFSLFFFSGDGTVEGEGKYRLLVDCARFADRHGFAAVWTPERHFQAFGGLYPNPSLTSAALAMVTERVHLRAGSVAVPLHHPLRVAEEWSMVDNLSGGRVGISFASGWHPQDFVLAPGPYAERRDTLFESLEAVRRLWAGESLEFEARDGSRHTLRVLPRPVQPRLPTWVTISGNPDTWRRAGEAGANVLTMLGPNPVEKVAPNLEIYRRALEENGHDPEAAILTVMVHAHLGPNEAEVKERVRGPMKDYLATYLKQQENITRKDTGFGTLGQMSDADRDALLDSSFERYYEHNTLLGTPEKAEDLVERLLDLGVGEVACLVDFGLPEDQVLSGLPHLATLLERYPSRGKAGS
jgi:natural product biosynthesis luciferase-like monooxygenase protein